MTVVSVLIGTISALINFTNRSSFISYKDDDDDKYSPHHRQHQGLFQILGIFLLIFAPLISRLIQLAISVVVNFCRCFSVVSPSTLRFNWRSPKNRL